MNRQEHPAIDISGTPITIVHDCGVQSVAPLPHWCSVHQKILDFRLAMQLSNDRGKGAGAIFSPHFVSSKHRFLNGICSITVVYKTCFMSGRLLTERRSRMDELFHELFYGCSIDSRAFNFEEIAEQVNEYSTKMYTIRCSNSLELKQLNYTSAAL